MKGCTAEGGDLAGLCAARLAVSHSHTLVCLTLQAFGKVGIPGAVVVLGYDWKSGSQEHWGALMAKLINDFAAGAAV